MADNSPPQKSSCVKGRDDPEVKLVDATGKRDHAMLDRVKTDEEILVFDVSDEVLETATGKVSQKANYTLGACTGLSVCPG